MKTKEWFNDLHIDDQGIKVLAAVCGLIAVACIITAITMGIFYEVNDPKSKFSPLDELISANKTVSDKLFVFNGKIYLVIEKGKWENNQTLWEAEIEGLKKSNDTLKTDVLTLQSEFKELKIKIKGHKHIDYNE